ncbi:MAG: glycoside hydrolase family 5 protein, partial [candidate division KSB1 bacterium]|nr:glycoside hydrolase family 5 protein [candidate division KSB1 bacterium]
MKRVVVCCLLAVSIVFAEVPFNRGVNITGWFQTLVPRHLQFTKFTKQDRINIKSLGCDVIRLPIFLQHMHAGPPEYKLDPILYHFLDQVIDWAEELEIYLILDYHTYDATLFTDPNLEKNLIAIWTQLATRYKDRSNYILYEIANEPNNISITKWGRVQGNVINAIRKVDEKHTII